MGSGVVLRNIANVVNLSTPLGLALAMASRARLRRVDGLLVAEVARLPWITASAMTVGSVVLVPRRTLTDVTRRIPGLLDHESEHAWQYAYCLGLPFIPVYAAAMGWSWLRTGDRASANHFEVQAGLAGGGYRARATRPVRDGLTEARQRVARWVSPGGDGPNGQPDDSGGGDGAA